MAELSVLIDYLENIAPLSLQEDYDNSGLIIGSRNTTIKSVLIALDVTEEVLEEAIRKDCNVIISHHPIIFKGLKKITGGSYVESTIIHAIKNDIALYAIHTNLDTVLQNGVNSKIGQKLNLHSIGVLMESDKGNIYPGTTGAGLIGFLKEPMGETDFLNYLKIQMKTQMIRHTKLLGKNIRKVAICGGAGSFLLNQALKEKADIFISADFKYHDFFNANSKIVIADIGHFESEQFTIELLYELITKKFTNFAALKTETYTNPIQYF